MQRASGRAEERQRTPAGEDSRVVGAGSLEVGSRVAGVGSLAGMGKVKRGNSGHSVLCVKTQRRTNLNYACRYSVVVLVCLEEILGCYTLESSSCR